MKEFKNPFLFFPYFLPDSLIHQWSSCQGGLALYVVTKQLSAFSIPGTYVLGYKITSSYIMGMFSQRKYPTICADHTHGFPFVVGQGFKTERKGRGHLPLSLVSVIALTTGPRGEIGGVFRKRSSPSEQFNQPKPSSIPSASSFRCPASRHRIRNKTHLWIKLPVPMCKYDTASMSLFRYP